MEPRVLVRCMPPRRFHCSRTVVFLSFGLHSGRVVAETGMDEVRCVFSVVHRLRTVSLLVHLALTDYSYIYRYGARTRRLRPTLPRRDKFPVLLPDASRTVLRVNVFDSVCAGGGGRLFGFVSSSRDCQEARELHCILAVACFSLICVRLHGVGFGTRSLR